MEIFNMSDNLVEIDIEAGIAVIHLNQGITNPIGPEMVDKLAGIFNLIRKDSGINGMVLTSANNKFFSIGFDIPVLINFSKEKFLSFFRSFNQMCLDLYTLPVPTAAAISGHATAGGCILALCCDYRFIAAGRKLIGLNEIRLGVPVPYVADRILYETVGTDKSRKIIESGEFFLSDQALELGLVFDIFKPENLLVSTVELLRKVMVYPGNAYALIKRYRTESVVEQILAKLEITEQEFIDCWYSEGARGKLREAIDKF